MIGDYIRLAGRKPDMFDAYRKGAGRLHAGAPDYNALVVKMKPEDSPFHCTVLKSDGTMWNVYEKDILGVAI